MTKNENQDVEERTKIIAKQGEREIIVTRVFDAPRELVFKAYTDPNLIPKWWGPRAYATIVDKMEVRVGGAWRFVNRTADGREFGFKGEYREIVPPTRLAYTFEFEDVPGHIALETITLEDRDGRTKVIDKMLFETVEDRDGMVKSGMERGATESMDRFAELLKEMRKETNHRDIAVEFLNLISSGRPKDGLRFFAPDCKTHNPYVPGGMDALTDSMIAVQNEFSGEEWSDFKLDIRHVLADGDLVAVHTQLSSPKPSKGGLRQVHLFRFSGDKIAEYWDITQQIPPNTPNADGAF